MKKIFLFFILIIIVIFITNCKKETINYTTISINTDEYIIKTSYIFINETILSLLNKEHAVILETIENNTYISCINALCANQKQYWAFCQNNNCYNNNPDKVLIQNNSIIKLYTYNLKTLTEKMETDYNYTV